MTTKQKNHPVLIPDPICVWMRQLGYVHDDEVEDASGTVKRTRARWKTLRPVYFGNEPWYQLDDIKRHLDIKADQNMDTEELVSL